MKMNYLLKSKRRPKHYRLPIFVVLIFLLCVFLISWITPKIFPTIAYSFAQPVWKVEEWITTSLSTPIAYFSSKKSLEENNRILSNTVRELTVQAAITNSLMQENVTIKRILGRDTDKKRILGAVVSRPPESPFGTMLVDIGSEEGVAAGDKVYAGSSVLLGEVAEVLNNSSTVSLYSRADNQIDVVLEKSQATVKASGRGEGNFVLQVAKDIDVQKGENVFAAGNDLALLGTVEDVQNDATSTFKQVFLRAPINTRTVVWVEVIKKQNK